MAEFSTGFSGARPMTDAEHDEHERLEAERLAEIEARKSLIPPVSLIDTSAVKAGAKGGAQNAANDNSDSNATAKPDSGPAAGAASGA